MGYRSSYITSARVLVQSDPNPHLDQMPFSVLGSCATAFLVVTATYLVKRALDSRSHDVNLLRGPSPASWLFGSLPEMFLPHNYGDHEYRWANEYGGVYRLQGVLGQTRLMVSDPVALNYLLKNDDAFYAPMILAVVTALYGRRNPMSLKDDPHRRLRAGLSVGFTPTVIKEYLDTFKAVASRITDSLLERKQGAVVDLIPNLSVATLSAIGQAAVGRSIESLDPDLNEAVFNVLSLAPRYGYPQFLMEELASHLPASFLDWMFSNAPMRLFSMTRQTKALCSDLGEQIVAELTANKDTVEANHLFAKILAGNSSKSLPTDLLVDQTSILLIAGQDTTTNTLAFALVELARNPALQAGLRAELLDAETDGGFDSLPLLNAVIKETLRLYPAEPISEKVALVDLTIPLGKPTTLKDGRVVSELFVRKGQYIGCGFAAYHRSPDCWGPRPEVFDPYRWVNNQVSPAGETMASSPYSNL
ncbi:unnamed protein product [Mycena citricolor]|uniref:Cytochrome P450 n=1 Tax=Mycena citricolor TaxID=2018698 RepID=A0AAD2H9Z0_9AGAR|nr:unnamed protein product [Mycena citricolor]